MRTFGLRELIILGVAISIAVIAPASGKFFWAEAKGIRLIETNLGEAELAAENFPGSAFYFMEENEAIPSKNPAFEDDLNAQNLNFGDNNISNVQSLARQDNTSVKPFVISPKNASYVRALKCLTDAIYYEGATEPTAGQRAIAQVILNRLRHPTYPTSVCGVIYQGSERKTGCQFSYSCDGSIARRPNTKYWKRARNVAASALAGFVYAPVSTATHYHTTEVNPYWAPSLNFIGTVGAHRFYRWKGSAGKSTAFFKSYAGREPFPGPKAKSFVPTKKELDPVELEQQYERQYRIARQEAAKEGLASSQLPTSLDIPAPWASSQKQNTTRKYQAPQYSNQSKKIGNGKQYGDEKLPVGGEVKSQYKESGSWKKKPA